MPLSKRSKRTQVSKSNSDPSAVSAQRSETMRAVKAFDTGPERVVRSIVHRMGFRFRLSNSTLPGKPDIVMRRHRTVIFVHGCFWHGHACRRGARTPKNNRDYWLAKIGRNKARDVKVCDSLRNLGWRVLVVWECELQTKDVLISRLRRDLEDLA